MSYDHIVGRIIDKAWLRKKIAEFFGGTHEKDKAVSVAKRTNDYIKKALNLIKKNKENSFLKTQ
ncbi:hypothetical protein [Bacteroidetes bacterium endosymbiont of Geopemphigus sp.]|uniref:hypothetical protein n=1 Tax=Bacteroidetes bacterium endosymbiont of Geopemphigus sp. TaxID=2047937 RepID=UPI000CD239AB|nr:hypothetical protein [Bacteroidetes bacterium endosymbiont of Geopemphigus sp.]